jgi:hypothetical protein
MFSVRFCSYVLTCGRRLLLCRSLYGLGNVAILPVLPVLLIRSSNTTSTLSQVMDTLDARMIQIHVILYKSPQENILKRATIGR